MGETRLCAEVRQKSAKVRQSPPKPIFFQSCRALAAALFAAVGGGRMLTARDKSQPQKCGECGAELPGGRPVVHCTRRRTGVSLPRVHHGRWRWTCPVCKRELGCDECAGRFASDVGCDRCHVYADGTPAIELSVEERRVLIEFVPHSTPGRAILLSRLAYKLCRDETHIKETVNSLRRKGLVIDQIAGRYYLLPRAETSPVRNVQPVGGIDLSLPLADRT